MKKSLLFMGLAAIAFASCSLAVNDDGGSSYTAQNRASANASTSSDNQGIDISYDNEKLIIAIDKVSDAVRYDIFINTDGDTERNSGFSSWLWSDKAANYLIEVSNIGSEVSLFNFTGKNWNSQIDTEVKVSTAYENNKVKFTIPFDEKGIRAIDVGNLSVACTANDNALVSSFISACKEVELTDSRIKLSYDYKYIYVSVEEEKDIYEMRLYVNSDGNVTTGENFWPWAEKTGADYLISKTGTSTPVIKNFTSNTSNTATNCVYENKREKSILRVLLKDLNISYENINRLSFGYYSLDSSWGEATVIPEKWEKPLVSVKAKETAPVVEQPLSVTKPTEEEFSKGGIIIPAYIHATDSAAWENLAVSAENFAASGKNFYVVINGDKGPGGFIVDKANTTYLKRIQKAGGKVIGYVHTCVSQKTDKSEYDYLNKEITHKDGTNTEYKYYGYRDIDTIINEIKAWQTTLNNAGVKLDGIWFDEFYPFFEIASNETVELLDEDKKKEWPIGTYYIDKNGNKKEFLGYINAENEFIGEKNRKNLAGTELIIVAKKDEKIYKTSYLLFPNGLNAAPDDSYIPPYTDPNYGFLYNATYVNWYACLKGGYYSQLFDRFKAEYPQLISIGNAGGDLRSNQTEYGKLVDILVSFEQNYVEASKHSKIHNNDESETPWGRLKRGGTDDAGKANHKLALIHGTDAANNFEKVSTAIAVAKDAGYEYVYVTSRVLKDNIWGGLPNSGDRVTYTTNNKGELEANIKYGKDPNGYLDYLSKELEYIAGK